MENPSIQTPTNSIVYQTGVVAFRFIDGLFEFCLITGRRSGRWGLPKGRIGSCTSIQEAALSEAWQEAGLTGTILGEPLGKYTDRKRGKDLEVTVWLMQVESACTNWKEAAERTRIWVSSRQAKKLVNHTHLNAMLEAANVRLASLDSGQKRLFPELTFSQLLFGPDSGIRK